MYTKCDYKNLFNCDIYFYYLFIIYFFCHVMLMIIYIYFIPLCYFSIIISFYPFQKREITKLLFFI